ncbi:MAG: hypothetical protein WC717_03690 [Candidatus Micrarchaeia archaeon]|jgi:hypothetical protein
MGGGLAKKHIFLILLVVLSLPGLLYAPCADLDVACDAGTECCSGSCSSQALACVTCLEIGDVCPSFGTCCGGYVCDGGTCQEPPPPAASGNWYDNIYVWAALAVIMASAFLGLAYMASQLFSVRVLEAWVKIELGELVKSMLIAVFCVALIASVNGASAFLSGEDGSTDVISSAQAFMYRLYGDGKALYTKLAVAYFNIAKVASYSYTAGMADPFGYATVSYSSSPASGMSPLVGEVGQALDSVANFMLLAASQAAFLKFFGSASIVMLPVGIFLRSFSFTRKLGGTLLAATIAAVVIYPSAILLSREVYGTFSQDLLSDIAKVEVEPAKNPPSAEIVCNPVQQYFVQSPLPFLGGEIGWWVIVATPICALSGPGFISCMIGMYQTISYVFGLLKAIFPFIIYTTVFITMELDTTLDKLMENYYDPLQQFALPAVAKFSVLSLVAFLIPIIISLSLLRALAAAFGGEAQLYGLSKLV